MLNCQYQTGIRRIQKLKSNTYRATDSTVNIIMKKIVKTIDILILFFYGSNLPPHPYQWSFRRSLDVWLRDIDI